MSELLGASIPDPRARIETYKNKHKDILKISAAHKSKENAVLNAAAVDPAVRTADMETFIKELTGRRQVQNNLTKGKGFPIWAKIAIPAAAVVLIATAVLVIPMFLGKSSADLPLDGQTVVPSVLHYNLEKAGEELKKYGLLPEIAGRKIDDSVGENEVLSQNVESGSIVGMNTVVGLTVSAHSNEISMPNLLGMNIGSCGELLDDLGLHYSISREKSASVSENCIISQSITPYTKITASQEIALTVSLGAPE